MREKGIEVLDMGFSAVAPAKAAPGGRLRRWRGSDVDSSACLVKLAPEALDGLRELLGRMRAEPVSLLLGDPAQFEMPRLQQATAQVDAILANGLGLAVVAASRLMRADEAGSLFWCLGQLVGRTVAQKWDGTMLYEVADRGQEFGFGVTP